MTILSTKVAIINGNRCTVETIWIGTDRQDIYYKVNDEFIEFDTFWELKPKFI